MGRNAQAYLVNWDEARRRCSTADDVDTVCNCVDPYTRAVPAELSARLSVYPLPWDIFVWKAALAVGFAYEGFRLHLPHEQRAIADELFGNLFTRWDEDELPTPACRLADDLELFAGSLPSGAVGSARSDRYEWTHVRAPLSCCASHDELHVVVHGDLLKLTRANVG